MVHYCCAPQCNTHWCKGSDVKFHSFPTLKLLKKVWIGKLRIDKPVSRSMKICSLHFRTADYEVTSMGQWRTLKKSAVPTQNLPKRPLDRDENLALKEARSSRANRRHTEVLFQQTLVVEEASTYFENPGSEIQLVTETVETTTTQEEIVEGKIVDHHTDVTLSSNSKVCTTSTGNQTRLSLHSEKLLSCKFLGDKQIKYFSGMEANRFHALLTFFTLHEEFRISELSVEDQFLLTLSKYRHNQPYTMLAVLFDVSRKVVASVFRLWTLLIYTKLKGLDFWASSPPKIGAYRAIIDSTEIPVESSSDPIVHQQTFSTYKNRTTFKALAAINEEGLVIFCSDLYGGSISDRQIVVESKFIEKLEKGDSVLADRGFDISDLLEKKLIVLNIPAFKKDNKISEKDRETSKAFSNVRIHVERIFGLTKVNKMLTQPMPTQLWPLANMVFFNCLMLCNMKQNIV